MISEQQIIDAAIEEVLNPKEEITEQYLEVLQVQMESGKPIVARIELWEDGANVYFPILGEQFFLAINIITKPNLKIYHAFVECGIRAYFTSVSDNRSFSELSSLVNLKPLSGWSKEDLRGKKENNNTYNFSRISFEPEENLAYDMIEKLELLLDELEKDAENIVALSKMEKSYISIVRYQYISGNTGMTFDIELLNRLTNLNLSFDIDTYIDGEPLKPVLDSMMP